MRIGEAADLPDGLVYAMGEKMKPQIRSIRTIRTQNLSTGRIEILMVCSESDGKTPGRAAVIGVVR